MGTAMLGPDSKLQSSFVRRCAFAQVTFTLQSLGKDTFLCLCFSGES